MNLRFRLPHTRAAGGREQRIRQIVALVFILVMVAFYLWFFATHLERAGLEGAVEHWFRAAA